MRIYLPCPLSPSVYRDLEVRHANLKSVVRERIDEANRGELAPLDIDAIKAELAEEL